MGDFTGDGKLDVAVACNGPNVVAVLMNTTPIGSSTISFASPLNLPAGGNPSTVAVADFNGDGKPDFAVAGNQNICVFLNTTPAGATTPSFAVTELGSGAVDSSPVADFNGDGTPDLVVAGVTTVSVLANTTPTGATTPSFTSGSTYTTGTDPEKAKGFADFNGDGKMDLVVANGHSGTVTTFLNTTPTGSTALSLSPRPLP